MDIKVWNKYQLEMFDRLSNYNKEVSFKEVVDSYKSDIETWGYFDGILLDNVEDYDQFSSVSNVIYSNGYLIIRMNIWDYLVINTLNGKVLTKEEVVNEIGESNFKKLDNEKSDFDFFYFLSCSDSKSIVEFFKNNSDVLLGKKRVIYNYQDKSGRIGLDFSLVKNEICIYIQSFDKDRHVNYISISGDFRPLHVSNQTGNMEDLRNMALSVKDMLVSSSLLKERVKSLKLD